jgi:hypothetical protein
MHAHKAPGENRGINTAATPNHPRVITRGFMPLALTLGWMLCGPGAFAADQPAATAAEKPALDPAGVAFFESKVRPLLVERCYDCHAADTDQKGSLQLDTAAGMRKGGDTGPALVPGDPEKSLFIKAVRYHDKNFQMPPDGRLADTEIAVLEEWVRMGAPDPRDGRPALTQIEELLARAADHWAFQPIVAPAASSLDELAGTVNAPEADRRTLIRRAFLDLVGVPPTAAEVEAFAADASPDAYARLVERLLADPRYGERWGRHWLDVARYADNDGCNGGQDGIYPFAWTYRDYVIQSIAADKPFDRFIQEQLAADQLDTKSDVATLAGLGFITVGWRKDSRLDDDTLDNALDTIGRGILGLSLSCARCHDHKLEPITTRDYYGLFQTLKYGREPADIPPLPQAETDQTREFREKNHEIRQQFARLSIKDASEATHKARSRLGDYLVLAEEAGWKNQHENKQVGKWCRERGLNAAVHDNVARSKAWVEAHPAVFGPFLEAIRKAPLEPAPVLHPFVAAAFAEPAGSLAEIGRRYNDLFAQADGLWRVVAAVELAKPVELTPRETDLFINDFFPYFDTLQPPFFQRLADLEERLPLSDPDLESLRRVLIAKGSGMVFDVKMIRQSRIIVENAPCYAPFGALNKLVKEHPGAPARPMMFADVEQPAGGFGSGYVYVRGKSDIRGPDAPRKFLTVLERAWPEPFPKERSGRLELARAITSRDNPLTPRVFVNRVWGWHFGTPLVATTSDFGFQGNPPTNQPLLDHLAAWFLDHGWSLKALHRYVMQSAAYRRADFPVRALELEPFRDSLLAVSGRLDAMPFGKAVKLADPGSTSTRRTVYGFVNRKMLPSLYRTFDFPSPAFTAGQRAQSTLAPRALILMNSPLVLETAKTLAKSLADFPDDAARVKELYRRVLQRDPAADEAQTALDYLAGYPVGDRVRPEAHDWAYGFGGFDPATKKITEFTAIAAFDGKAFRGQAKMPDGKAAAVMVDALGGDAGPGLQASSIRRWVAPLDGKITVMAELAHADNKTPGVIARVVLTRPDAEPRVLGEWQAHGSAVETAVGETEVRRGDTLDFVVTSQSEADAGPFEWSPMIRMPGVEMPGMPGVSRRWDARTDFADPAKPAPPLSALEELCQAVLLSPEFAVIE